jgi:hypothetical protein
MFQRRTTADLGAVLRFVYSSGVRPRLAHPKARMSMFCSISRLTNGIVIVLGAVLGARPIGFLHQPQFAPLVSGLVMDGGVDIGNEQTPKSWPLSENKLEQLYSWLQSRSSHWRMVLATPPRPSSSILLTHSDGRHTEVDLYSGNESWQRVIGIRRFDPEGTFFFGGQMWPPIDEITTLKALSTEQTSGRVL